MGDYKYTSEISFKENSDQFETENAYVLAQAANLAYESEDKINTVIDKWEFEPCEFFDGKEQGTQGFIACHSKFILLAFRGTEPSKIKDLMTDAKASMQPELGGKVHEGFKDGLDDIWPAVKNKIKHYQNKQARPVWITGHSLGAALATLAAVRLQLNESQDVQGLYIFGSPRVFNSSLAEKFDEFLKQRVFRFVNNNDVVTRVPAPFPSFMHFTSWYRHIGTIRYFNEKGDFLEEVNGYNWMVFLDHIKGRVKDLGELHTDGMKDHSMIKYCDNCKKLS